MKLARSYIPQRQKLASPINKSMADGCVALHDAGIATSNVSVFTGYTRPNYLHTCDSPRYIL